MDISEYFSIWELIIAPFYLLVIFFITNRISATQDLSEDQYDYMKPALFYKITGGLLFTAIYTFYYPGGDCHAYYSGGKALNNMLFTKSDVYFSIMEGHTTRENWSHFILSETGTPPQNLFFKGGTSFAVARFISPFLLISLNYMTIGTILLDCFSFIGIWKFFMLLCRLYPRLKKKLALAILFLPSIAFWGSGIMKDTFTFSATLWLTASAYEGFIERKNLTTNILASILNIFIIISIKPYILIALIPTLALSIALGKVRQIKNRMFSWLMAPLFLATGIGAGMGLLSLLSKNMETYSSVENVVTKAQINQQDLIRSEQYGSNSYNIGPVGNSATDLLKKAPQAVVAGLFRPFIWEARNPVMIISGLENLAILLVTIYLLIKSGPIRLIKNIVSDPFLLFSFTFAIIFAYSVGLTTGNFGALVRYKIPGIPFLLSGLIILYYNMKDKRMEEASAIPRLPEKIFKPHVKPPSS